MSRFVRARAAYTFNDQTQPERSLSVERGDILPEDHWAVRTSSTPDAFEPVTLDWQAEEAAEALVGTRREIASLQERRNPTPGHAQRLDNLRRREAKLTEEIRRSLENKERIRATAENPAGSETADPHTTPAHVTASRTDTTPEARRRTVVRRTLDGLRHIPDEGMERLTASFDRAEAAPDGHELDVLSRWLLATSAPAYARAVGKLFADPENGHREFDSEELQAYRTARTVQRAMSIGTDSAGGFLLPTHLDPSIMLTNDGTIDPVRQVARKATIATNEWHGITSAGVDARWAPENTEAGDNSPTVGDPSVKVHKADAFVIASIEAAADTNIGSQLAALFADAKARLEATAFTTGDGVDKPRGLVPAVEAAAGSVVATGAAASYARGDILKLQESVPPRWRSRAAFMMALEVLNMTREFPKLEGGVDASLVDDSGRVRGWGTYENSNMAKTLATGNDIAVAGDFQQYLVVDRVGTTVEYIPHLFGPNRRPTGQRGWYMYWRTGGDALIPEAFRLLRVA